MEPIPQTNLSIHEEDGKRFVVVEIFAGEETPYYVRHKGSLTAYVRIGNESVKADPLELNRLVLKGSRRSWDSLPSVYKRKDFSFEVLYATYHEKTKLSFEESDFQSFGLVTDDGHLTNAGALFADKSPVRHSRVFCTRWNGLDKAHGLMESFDDDEYSGGLLSLLNAAKDFVRRNRRMMWRKTPDSRIDYPEYPERAYEESIINGLIHRDYLELGSEVHIDIFDDRMEIYSPGGMPSGDIVQTLDPRDVSSKRRNPVIADLFQRLDLMERRGSGFKKILNAYQFESEKRGHEFVPTFRSTGSSFFVILPNLNYGIKINGVQQDPSQVTTEVTTQVTTQVTTEVKRLVIALIGEMRSDALMASIGIKQKEDFRTRYLKPAIVNGFVEMTQPDSPRSPTQKYRLTEKGVTLAKQQEA